MPRDAPGGPPLPPDPIDAATDELVSAGAELGRNDIFHRLSIAQQKVFIEHVREVRAIPAAIVGRIRHDCREVALASFGQAAEAWAVATRKRERLSGRLLTAVVSVACSLVVGTGCFTLGWYLRGEQVISAITMFHATINTPGVDAAWLAQAASVNDLSARHKQCENTMRAQSGGFACTVDLWVQLPPATGVRP